MRVTPQALDRANHEELKERIASHKQVILRELSTEIIEFICQWDAALQRSTEVLKLTLPKLSPADAKTMGIVSAMISENEKLLGGSHE